MRLALLTSDHPRHMWMAHQLAYHHTLPLVIAESKGNDAQMVGNIDTESALLRSHFDSLDAAQNRFFGSITDFPSESATFRVVRGGINTEMIVAALRKHAIEGVAVFGCGIINSILFECCSVPFVNAHQGISPYYRGSGTNFWPIVHGEPELIGVTMHYLDAGIDTGGIICHGRPQIRPNDTMHDVGCRAVEKSAELFARIFELLEFGVDLFGFPQTSKGRLYQRKDFNAQAVQAARTKVDNGLFRDYSRSARPISGAQLIELI